MPNVEFEQTQFGSFSPRKITQDKQKSLVGWLIDKGLAKNEKTANLILIVTIIISILLGFIIVTFSFGDHASPLTNRQKQSIERNTPHSPR